MRASRLYQLLTVSVMVNFFTIGLIAIGLNVWAGLGVMVAGILIVSRCRRAAKREKQIEAMV